MNKSILELSLLIKGNTQQEVFSELFGLIKADKDWLTQVVMDYCEYQTKEILDIKLFTNEYERLKQVKDEGVSLDVEEKN